MSIRTEESYFSTDFIFISHFLKLVFFLDDTFSQFSFYFLYCLSAFLTNCILFYSLSTKPFIFICLLRLVISFLRNIWPKVISTYYAESHFSGSDIFYRHNTFVYNSKNCSIFTLHPFPNSHFFGRLRKAGMSELLVSHTPYCLYFRVCRSQAT